MQDCKEEKGREKLIKYDLLKQGETKENHFEDEIDLSELIFILWKQRGFCIFVITAITLVGILYILITPVVYKITCQVRPGITGYDDKGNPVRDLVPQDVRLYFEKRENWLGALSDPNELKSLNIIVKNRRDSSIVDISIFHRNPQTGVTILKKVLSYVTRDSFGKVDREIQFFRKSVGQALNKVIQNKEHIKIEQKRLEDNIRKVETKLRILKVELDTMSRNRVLVTKSVQNLKKQLTFVNKNTLELLESRQKVQKAKEKEIIAFLVYLNIVQQNIEYLNNLQSRITTLKKELNQYDVNIMRKKAEIDNLGITMEDLKLKKDKELPMKEKDLEKKIETLKAKLAAIQPLEILTPPTSSLKPVKPKKKLVLALALVLGFFTAIFLAFVKNFWEINMNRSESEKNSGDSCSGSE